MRKYVETEEQYYLGLFLEECKGLLSVIAHGLATSEEHKEDLMQEARLQMLRVMKDYDFNRDKKLYSWLSIVFRNAMIDSIRKDKPSNELTDMMEDPYNDVESDYIVNVAEEMLPWFTSRFPTLVSKDVAYEILESILGDVIDESVGKRKLISNLKEHHNYSAADARLLCDAVIVKLRILMSEKVRGMKGPAERSLDPELLEVIGNEGYRETKLIFRGLSLKFSSTDK